MNTQETSIIDAVRKKQYAIVEMELKKGVNANKKDKSNKPLLLIATEANDLEMAKLLVLHGADVNVLQHAKSRNYLGIVKILQKASEKQ